MVKSDEVLKEIIEIAESWEDTQELWSSAEWEIVVRIRESLVFKTGKRVWNQNPVWYELRK